MISDLLICGRKAASESEAREVVARAIGLTKIDGMPFRTLAPENFHFNSLAPEAGARHLRKSLTLQYREGRGRSGLDRVFWRCFYGKTMKELCLEAFKNAASGQWSPESYILRRRGFGYLAHHYGPSFYQNPVLAFTVIPGEEGIKKIVGTSLSIDKKDAEALPGSNPQWRFFVWAHEMAHGLGAGEPQADFMAAVLCRRIFADTRFLMPWIDFRAINAFRERHDESAERYGCWAMVKAMDRAMAMDPGRIDAMDERDVLALRFEEFGTGDRAAVQRLGNRMESRAFSLAAAQGLRLSMKPSDPCILQAAMEIRGESSDLNERRIADRFLLAVNRLMVDPSAYTRKTPDHVRELAYA